MCQKYVSQDLAKLTPRERMAVMDEALRQYENREDDDSDIVDFIENGIDMLTRDTYVVVRNDKAGWSLQYEYHYETKG